MANLVSSDSEAQASRLIAQASFEDCFKSHTRSALNYISKEVETYLTDYFLLLSDLKTVIKEESRRGFSDYSFIVFPVHKAFESYLSGSLFLFFRIKVSSNSNESIGHYLSISDSQKIKFINEAQKRYPHFLSKLSNQKWVDAWNALKRQWSANRNLLTHVDGEKITNLRQAEQVANSIIREIDLSVQLFTKEFFEPLMEYAKAKKEQEEKEKQV